MSEHFADRLLAAIEEKGSPVCVGIDPVFDLLPPELKKKELPDAITTFCAAVVQAVHPYVPAVKPQIACFERYGAAGLAAYQIMVGAIRQTGLIVIGDVKRGDIGSSAAHYAAGHLGGETVPNAMSVNEYDSEPFPDAITVNGYFGADGLKPFVDTARDNGKGIFVLVRTSNPSAAVIQDFADAGGKKFYEHVAEQVADIGSGEGLIGRSGYSCVGAVVGATYPEEARRLREIMPQQIFLVPGYGAQGATAADCAAAFKPDGTGAIVNASRSVIYAYQREEYAGMDWEKAIETAAKKFADDIRQACSLK